MTTENTIERLILYRRILSSLKAGEKTHVYSYQIAKMADTTAAIVRRDLMNFGYYGTPRHGYEIESLLKCMEAYFNENEAVNIIIVGIGNLGRALITFLSKEKRHFTLVAAFDQDPLKIGKKIEGCTCYPMEKLETIVKETNVSVGIITVTPEGAQYVVDELVKYGIKGILNFAPIPLNVPPTVFIENMDITLLLEKVIYFAQNSEKLKRDVQVEG